jgi:hypothetical protein
MEVRIGDPGTPDSKAGMVVSGLARTMAGLGMAVSSLVSSLGLVILIATPYIPGIVGTTAQRGRCIL